ncbi:hypothetical protein [Chryseobacterium indoltheticum]|uniref:hypothetical protein n=1 Tax=Chryseobacterium indoltheticum TaxID=254 RepID=UPI003F4915D5
MEEKLGIACESIMDVINKNILTSGTFRWFLRDNPPKKRRFSHGQNSKYLKWFTNKYLWEKLAKPIIDKDNPPSVF